MKKLPIDVERKLGMIKAKGIDVKVTFDEITKHWEINIGEQQWSDLVPDEGLRSYASDVLDKELK